MSVRKNQVTDWKRTGVRGRVNRVGDIILNELGCWWKIAIVHAWPEWSGSTLKPLFVT